MKQVYNFYFPDYETHFPKMLEKSLKKEGHLRYQSAARDFAVSLCSLKRVSIDIGGNVGLWSCELVDHFEKVIIFEPVKEFIDCLKLNLRRNNFEIHQVALGNQESSVNMKIVEGNTGHTHIDLTSISNGDTLLKKLDSFNFTNVDLIKIDVEGYENQVLEGAYQTILSNKPVIIVEQTRHEYQNDKETLPAVKLLQNWGYKVQGTFNKDWVLTT